MPEPCYIDVILPLPVAGTFTYSIGGEDAGRVKPGMRVTVQFGKRKIYTALVRRKHNQKPGNYETKEILSLLDAAPVVTENQFILWDWISAYYMCTPGEVFNAALPSGLKLESETNVRALSFPGLIQELNDTESLVLRVIRDKPGMRVADLQRLSTGRDLTPALKSLLEKGFVALEERLEEKYRPKTITGIRISQEIITENRQEEILEKLAKSPAKKHLFMECLAAVNNITPQPGGIERKMLLENTGVSAAVLSDLIRLGILQSYETVTSRAEEGAAANSVQPVLNDSQQKALDEITLRFESTDVVLLHGITSSGKTEVYIRLIRDALIQGKQILYLLPEIAITTQIISRLRSAFGPCVTVYHSKFSDAERVETWQKILDPLSGIQIVLGVRSAIFLPFTSLGLIIVDEEHENTYKQFDPSPRYHARDTAIMLARFQGARVLLGTATPSVETYFNCKNGKYGLVELSERYSDMQLPEIRVENTRDLRRRRKMQSHFSPALIDGIREALENHEQVILFQNRRGFSLFLQCEQCGEIPHCQRCDVSLTYHKLADRLTCHYCGYSTHVPKTCPVCNSPGMKMQGFGTEKVADEINLFFPEARVTRMDLDTTRTRKSYEKLIAGFESGNSDILVGTQMVSKGLDFDNVRLVGIVNADTMINFPDFRAYERSYQLMAQVSGRAGRKNKRGMVIIQTADHKNPVIDQVVRNDYKDMYNTQLEERRKFKYPPFYRLIKISLRHREKEVADRAAGILAGMLRTDNEEVLGPEYPLVSRTHNQYIKCILVKIPSGKSLLLSKKSISAKLDELFNQPDFKSVQKVVDVDPY